MLLTQGGPLQTAGAFCRTIFRWCIVSHCVRMWRLWPAETLICVALSSDSRCLLYRYTSSAVLCRDYRWANVACVMLCNTKHHGRIRLGDICGSLLTSGPLHRRESSASGKAVPLASALAHGRSSAAARAAADGTARRPLVLMCVLQRYVTLPDGRRRRAPYNRAALERACPGRPAAAPPGFRRWRIDVGIVSVT